MINLVNYSMCHKNVTGYTSQSGSQSCQSIQYCN